MSKTDSVDRSASAYEKFMRWSKGSIIQTFAGALLVLGSLIYQIWQDPGQFEFVKIIAIVFIVVAVIEEYFKVRNKSVDLERDKLDLDKWVKKIEKTLQAQFIKNKHAFQYDVMGLFLNKIENYLDGEILDSSVVKSYREMIGSVLSRSKKYAGMIENKYKDFLETMLDDRELEDVPITPIRKTMIMDTLTNPTESDLKEKVEENKKKIDDFNKNFDDSAEEYIDIS